MCLVKFSFSSYKTISSVVNCKTKIPDVYYVIKEQSFWYNSTRSTLEIVFSIETIVKKKGWNICTTPWYLINFIFKIFRYLFILIKTKKEKYSQFPIHDRLQPSRDCWTFARAQMLLQNILRDLLSYDLECMREQWRLEHGVEGVAKRFDRHDGNRMQSIGWFVCFCGSTIGNQMKSDSWYGRIYHDV